MFHSLSLRLRYLLILATLLLSVGVVPIITSFAKPVAHSQISPMWGTSGNLLLSRFNFRATTLPSGKVLIEGGFAPGSYTTDSELFDPATGVWTQTGSLNQGRGEHSATLLQDGRVLVAGGYAGPVLTSSELYNPTTGTWTLTTGSMSQPRTRHTATLLPNGKVLVAGGWVGSMVSSAELYDPVAESWSSAGNMAITRADHVAVLLPDGHVLVAGGAPVNGGHTTEAELYDPNTNTWTPTGSMNVARANFTAVLLSNGKVLAIGGDTDTGSTATTELYDPAKGTWTLTGSMQKVRTNGLGSGALGLANGTVLVAGGDASGTSEVYTPSSGTWGSLTTMVAPHCGDATTLLHDGRVLLTGGNDCTSPDNTLVATELYTSTTPTTLFTYPIASSNVSFTIGYGLQNSGLAGRNGCYWDSTKHQYVPFNQLWHAGEDWFAKTPAGATIISAVANGVVKYVSPPGYNYPGAVIIIQHTLSDGSLIYSMYGHLNPQKLLVKVGNTVTKGQPIAKGLIPQKSEGRENTHLHWEIRYFFDGFGITKGPTNKQTCSAQPGPGYTWPGQPDNFVFNGKTYRWTNPSQFVAAHM